MTDAKVLINALRCSATPVRGHCDEDCPYRLLERCKEYDIPADVFIDGVGYWESCDCDQIALDAADMIEKLTEGGILNGA